MYWYQISQPEKPPHPPGVESVIGQNKDRRYTNSVWLLKRGVLECGEKTFPPKFYT